MSFPLDLIVVDYETNGTQPELGHDPVEIGAVRVDRETLEPKAEFHSFIRPRTPEKASPRALEIHGLDMDVLKGAPLAPEVVYNFERALYTPEERQAEQFGRNAYLSSWNTSFDLARYHHLLLTRADLDPDRHGYHHFDLWTHSLATIEALDLKVPEGRRRVGLDTLFRILGMPEREGAHSALEDARLEAEAFRRLRGHIREALPTRDTGQELPARSSR